MKVWGDIRAEINSELSALSGTSWCAINSFLTKVTLWRLPYSQGEGHHVCHNIKQQFFEAPQCPHPEKLRPCKEPINEANAMWPPDHQLQIMVGTHNNSLQVNFDANLSLTVWKMKTKVPNSMPNLMLHFVYNPNETPFLAWFLVQCEHKVEEIEDECFSWIANYWMNKEKNSF